MRNRVYRFGCLLAVVGIAAVTGLDATAPAQARAVQTDSAQAAAVRQTPLTPAVLTPVPRVIWFSGAFTPADKRPVAPVETVTVAVYREREGGDAVWQEMQTVTMEADGRYSLLMGSTLSDGMPLEVFTSGEPRWIGITVNRPGEMEQPRVHLASVPYALKAADTDTLGGKPAAAYQLVEQKTPHGSKLATDAASPLSAGTPGYLGMFVDAANLGNSALYQNGGAIGVGTTAPADALHVRFNNGNGGATGYAVQNLSSAVNAYSGMLFYDQNGALGQFQGFNNSTHEYRINNIATGGSINFMIGTSKFMIANSGNIGVGVAAPASKLDVAGDVNMTGTLNMGGTIVLRTNSSNPSSVGLGFTALGNNTGANNTATGFGALHSNTTGNDNTGIGSYVLSNNMTGYSNTSVGHAALQFNNTGANNTAIGVEALNANQTGVSNTSVGAFTLRNSSGASNTAVGHGALYYNFTGSNNIAIGYNAGTGVGSGNSNNIDIGAAGAGADSGTIRIGTSGTQTSFFAAGVRGVTTGASNAVPVVIDANGQLGTISSSRRFKEDIHDMGEASRGLMRLRPVTFRYKKPFDDGSKPIQYGLIAEEVAEVYPDLVARSADGQIETVKYQVLDAMLLNEVQQQQADIRAQQAEIRGLNVQIRAVIQQNEELQQRLASLEAALAGRR